MTPLAILDLLIKEIRHRDQIPYRLVILRPDTPGHNTAGVKVCIEQLGTRLVCAQDTGEDYNQAVQDCCSVLLADGIRELLKNAKNLHDNPRPENQDQNHAG